MAHTPTALHQRHTETAPEVQYHPATNALAFSGACFPSNALDVFEPIQHWLQIEAPLLGGRPFTLVCALYYINTSSTKQMYDLVDRLKQHREAGHISQLSIVWVYETDDEETEELGQDLGRLMQVPTTLVCSNRPVS